MGIHTPRLKLAFCPAKVVIPWTQLSFWEVICHSSLCSEWQFFFGGDEGLTLNTLCLCAFVPFLYYYCLLPFLSLLASLGMTVFLGGGMKNWRWTLCAFVPSSLFCITIAYCHFCHSSLRSEWQFFLGDEKLTLNTLCLCAFVPFLYYYCLLAIAYCHFCNSSLRSEWQNYFKRNDNGVIL